jgi:uncharacterized protein (UPF0332 family)
MSFDWKDYVYLAEELLSRSKESCLRSSISRAYYGVFCISRDKAGLKSYRPRPKIDPGVHAKVISTYKTSMDKDKKLIGLTLDELRRLRNKADYNGDMTINKNYADRAIKMAYEVLKGLGVP